MASRVWFLGSTVPARGQKVLALWRFQERQDDFLSDVVLYDDGWYDFDKESGTLTCQLACPDYWAPLP